MDMGCCARRRFVICALLFAPAQCLQTSRRTWISRVSVSATATAAAEAPVDSPSLRPLKGAEAWFAKSVAARGDAPARLAAAHVAGEAALETVMLPTRKQEPWRFTDLASVWACPSQPLDYEMTELDDSCFPAEADAAVVVVVDGVVDEARSRNLGALAGGGWAGSVHSAPADVLAAAQSYLEQLPEVALEDAASSVALATALSAQACRANSALGMASFVALNAACATDAVLIVLPPGAAPAEAVHVLHVSAVAQTVSYPRLVVVQGEGSLLRLRQAHYGARRAAVASTSVSNDCEFVVNARTTLALAEKAELEHVYVHDSASSSRCGHLENVALTLADEAKASLFTLSLQGSLTRVGYDVDLAGVGASLDMDCLQLGSARDRLDLRSQVRHESPDANSKQTIRSVGGGDAVVTFKGRIYVPQLGQGTDAQQICRSLVLTDTATIQAMPSLEVIADNVKCTHGATVADLDEEAIFYLESRGLSRIASRAILVKAFCVSVIAKTPLLPKETADRLDAKILSFIDEC